MSLCFYFQQLLNNDENYICWVLYGEEFKQHLGNWSNKCKNKIIDYDSSIQAIKNSDLIIYQNIDENKSVFSNTNKLRELTNGCKLIQIPSIYLVYNDFNNSLKELINRENLNNVDIKISTILHKFQNINLMLTCNILKHFYF